jgi:hypothetical protein
VVLIVPEQLCSVVPGGTPVLLALGKPVCAGLAQGDVEAEADASGDTFPAASSARTPTEYDVPQVRPFSW